MSVFSTKFGKASTYYLDPAVIKLPDHQLQGRFSLTPKMVIEMADSLLVDGQRQNITVRKDEAQVPILVFGFRRHAAGLMINTLRQDPEFRAKLTSEAVAKLDLMGDKPFLLEAKLENINDREAFLANIGENVDRVDLSPMDRLKIIRVLRDTFNMSDDDIAAVFGKKAWYVYHHLKLATLSDRIQDLVDKGIISLEVAAKTLVKIPEAQRDAIVDAIIEEAKRSTTEDESTVAEGQSIEGIKITGAAVAAAERNRRAASNGEGDQQPTTIKRTLADTKKFYKNYIEKNDPETDPVAAMFADMLAFTEGKIQEAGLVKRMRKRLGATPASKTA